MKALAHIKNPLLTIEDVIPSSPNMKVDGIFNCGAIKFNNKYLLLCRVAESAINDDTSKVLVPIMANNNGVDEIKIVELIKSEYPNYDFSDSRQIFKKGQLGNEVILLTSMSHFRIATSTDGVDFTLDSKPTILPRSLDESWGIEDPRITLIDNTYYINYTSVSENGASTSLITTKDFQTFDRHGIIFAPENKDVAIFPKKINGKYYAFNRPVPKAIGSPDMWIAESLDLLHFGAQQIFYKVTNDGWENGRIGGGAVPFLTDKGWIKIYHAADSSNRYCLGAFLLDKDDPRKILGKTTSPILEPTHDYEINGFFGNVVFTCGAIVEGDTVNIYYGAADDKICLAQIKISDILLSM